MMDPNHERRALLSLLDCTEQLLTALELSSLHLQKEFADEWRQTFDRHRRELAGEVVAWPQEPE